jgi:flagellar M-ring protein FliF
MFAKIKSMAAGVGGHVKLPSSATLMKLLPIVVLAIALTALAMMFMWRSEAGYKPLFGAKENVSAAETMEVLESEGIPYRIHPQSGQVLVPDSKLGRARMVLAAKGVVAKLPEGLETVDKNDPLGVSQFVQDVRFRRGLEGELVKSIMSLDPVEAARVHLSIAKSSSFILSDGDKSSASVVLTLKPGRKLSKEQIGAIIGMVSGSVANLDPTRVAVVDQHGNYLSSTIDPNDPGAADSEIGARIREETLRNIHDLLTKSLGEGNFKASVMVETDHDRIEEMHEQYGDKPLVTNEATREEQDNNQMALGVPGSLSNRPATGDKKPDEKSMPTSQKNAITRQYVYDRNVVQIKRAPARLKRVSVAVVLNSAAAPDGKEWTTEQLGKIESILRSGIGMDEAREDQLTVSALDFHTPAVEAPLPWWKQPENMMTMGMYAAYGVLALLILLLVVRPLIKILRQWVASQAPQVEAVVETSKAGDAEAVAPAATTSRTPPKSPLSDEDIPLPPIGSSADVLVEHLKVLAAQAPERVADVIKPWIRKHG